MAPPLIPRPTAQRLAQWRRLMLNTARSFAGGSGRRLGPTVGGTIEFADFRPYSPGDDLRTVDWNLYARSDRLWVRTFLKEQEVRLALLLDASESMATPDAAKYRLGAGLTIALAYAGLCEGYTVRVGLLRESGCETTQAATREAAFPGLLDFLSRRRPGGRTALAAGVERFLADDRGRSFVVLVSDLLDPQDPAAIPATLAERGHAVHLLHTLSADDLHPHDGGPVVLVDAETGETSERVLDEGTIDAYREALSRRLEDWRGRALRQGFYYRLVPAALGVDEALRRLTGPGELLVSR